jgi:hypothetical protein
MNFQTNKFFFPLETFSAIKSLLPEANSLSSVAFILNSSSSYFSITLRSFAIFSACLSLNPIWALIIVHLKLFDSL